MTNEQKFLFYALALASAAYIAVFIYTNRRLRVRHPDVWQTQGQPTFWNNSPVQSLRFIKFFVFSSRHRALGDPALDRAALIAKALFALGCLLLGGFVLSI